MGSELRDRVHMDMLAVSDPANKLKDLTVVPLGFAVQMAFNNIKEEQRAMLERLKQFNGAYIGMDGKRVNNMIHHDVIDAELAKLEGRE